MKKFPKCTVRGCGAEGARLGLCDKHYMEQYRARKRAEAPPRVNPEAPAPRAINLALSEDEWRALAERAAEKRRTVQGEIREILRAVLRR